MEGVQQRLGGLVTFLRLQLLHIGTTLRLASFILLSTTSLLFLFVGLSLTIIKSITIIDVSAVNSIDPILNAITKLRFGVWGVCTTSVLDAVKAQQSCYGPQLGYIIPTSLLSLVGLSSELSDVAGTTLLALLVLHLVCAVLSIIDFIFLFFPSHSVSIMTPIIAIITATLSTIVFAVDVALVISVRTNIDSLFSGADFVVSFGNGVWMTLVAMILTWIVVVVLWVRQRYYFDTVECPKPRAPDYEKDSMEKAVL